MSSYGTSADYCRGYDAGADETQELYEPLVTACKHLLELWAENKNLTVPAQAIQTALDNLPSDGRLSLDSTTYPTGYEEIER